ncbi:fimbria/pilus outer membrane usher protein [Trabulsiella odontotermitis]|uniref:Fimbrial assembly protein n=1 Tax=Trabulsiella odontotermitis TaxID=379893 RepID=A0A0L0GXJ1_9ENTR|nr:fimbria/pilus outer membrane usher protein [Trabulsiella odontotermitis]KNC93489.1 hypothetical protein GM31_19350 [Trabulsiella odontotermitis]
MKPLKLSLITLSILMAIAQANAADAVADVSSAAPQQTEETAAASSEEEVEFDGGFISGYGIDVKKFSKGNPVIPGEYQVRFLTNTLDKGQLTVNFTDDDKDGDGEPCFTRGLLKSAGVKLPESVKEQPEATCLALRDVIPTANWKMDVNSQTFTLNVSQADTFISDDGTVDPELWQNGINALLLQYNLNGYSSRTNDQTNRNLSGNFNGGINLGAWRFRSSAYASWNEEGGYAFDTGDYYLERDVAFLRGQVRLGSTYSDGQLFDSFKVKGVTLKSDDRMLPFSKQGFFPVIRGVAETNAKVVVKQDNYVIYETTVPPGAFEFSNIRSGNVGTDIDVEVTEADGRVKTFTVPYSTSSQMLRPGVSRYNVTVGEYDGGYNYSDKPLVAQGTWQQGLSNAITAYAGLQGTEHYWAGVIGGTLNTAVGAFSFDVTNSMTQIPDGKQYVGQSYKLSYDQYFDVTRTNFQLAAYRYSTSGYFSLSDAMDYIYDDDMNDLSDISRSRNKFQLSVSQTLADGWGSLYANASIEDYWDSDEGKNTQYQFGYNNNWGRVSYSLSVSKFKNGSDGNDETQYFLNLSVPLSWGLDGDSRPYFDTLNMSYSTNDKHDSTTSIGASGYDADNEFNYGINANYNHSGQPGQKDNSAISGNASVSTRFARLGGTVTRSNEGDQQLSFSANGGMIGHSGGVTFSPDINLSGPMALIEAKGAEGSKVQNGSARIDGNGYAVATSLSPYIENKVGLDISTLETDTELKNTISSVIPHDGSVVRVKFDTDDRRFVMFIAKRPNGLIPLGADIYSSSGEHLGYAGQGGKLLTRGATPEDEITVRWGEGDDQQCRFRVPAEKNAAQDVQGTTTVEGITCR